MESTEDKIKKFLYNSLSEREIDKLVRMLNGEPVKEGIHIIHQSTKGPLLKISIQNDVMSPSE